MKASLLRGFDSMAIALADAGHVWTKEERRSYEKIVRLLKKE